jgi:hypothetical protein
MKLKNDFNAKISYEHISRRHSYPSENNLIRIDSQKPKIAGWFQFKN